VLCQNYVENCKNDQDKIAKKNWKIVSKTVGRVDVPRVFQDFTGHTAGREVR
jgi:hypothetical protein